jgi:hypothetical protein
MDITFEAGTLTAAREDRIVTGLLVPYGEMCRSNLGKFSVARGVFEVPADVSVLNATLDHDREEPRARFVSTTDTDRGRLATFKVAKGPEGDQLLADIESGKRKALSVEAKGVVIRAGRAIAGRIFGASFVKAGAFPSATLLAADVGDLDDDVIEVNGVRYARVPESTEGDPKPLDNAVETAEEEATVAETETVEETVETDNPEETEEERKPLLASRPGSLGGKTAAKGKTLFATLAGAQMPKAATLMAALDNIIAADGLPTQQQQWLGEVYGSKTYTRRFASLMQHGDLNALKAVGWKFTTNKTPVVAAYNGFPAQPNSNEVKTEAVTLDAARLAGAGAVDRAFLDFPTPEFWAGYFREQTNSYERVLDGIARDALIAGATAVTGGAVPDGVSTAAAYLVDGAIAIIEAERDLPSFALVGSALYREFLLTRADDTLAYLTAALGLEEGSLEGFKIVPSSVATLVGKVLVGTKTSATLFELPGTPVRVDTVAIATGGVERGVFGYHAELINDAMGLALVGAAG